MTDDDGTLDAEPCESLSEHISLSGGSPHRAPRPVAIPKTRAVKRDNVTLPLTGEVEQPTQIAILGCDDITMEKDYWPPRAPSRGSGAGSRRRQQTGREVDAPALLFLLDRCSTVPCQPWRRPPILPKPRRFAIALPESRSMHSPLRVRSMFFSGCEVDFAPQHAPSENPANQTKVPGRWPSNLRRDGMGRAAKRWPHRRCR
jgi:hypothetical protein